MSWESSQTPSQPKGIGDLCRMKQRARFNVVSQTPSQPKGIGDTLSLVKGIFYSFPAKPPHSRKALETLTSDF